MKRSWAPFLAAAAVAGILAPAALEAPVAGARSEAAAWCGNSGAKDRVCRWRGRAYASETPGTSRLLPRRRPQRLFAGTRVATASNGLARVAFRDEANCTIGGGSDEPSEIVARWEPDVLMRHVSGDYECSTATGDPVESFCKGPEGPCTVKIRARGTYLSRLAPPPEATASLTETFHRHARIVICSGFVRIRVADEAGSSEAVGRSNGRSRFVITIDERVERTEDETVTPTGSSSISSSSSSVELGVVGIVPGRGACASSVVQSQERFVGE